jgi:hypothetical protein
MEDWRGRVGSTGEDNFSLLFWWRARRWARLLAKSPSRVVDVFDELGGRICSGLHTRDPEEGLVVLVPDHFFAIASSASREGTPLSGARFMPWPSRARTAPDA